MYGRNNVLSHEWAIVRELVWSINFMFAAVVFHGIMTFSGQVDNLGYNYTNPYNR